MNSPPLGARPIIPANRGANGLDDLEDLKTLERKIAQISSSILTFACDQQQITRISREGYLQQLDITRFNELLPSLIKCFCTDEQFLPSQANFQRMFENAFDREQFCAFVNRLSLHLLPIESALQEKLIMRFLNLISSNRLQTIVAQVFAPQTFEKGLLSRVKADASSFPHLTNYEAPKGILKELKTIWQICIEDIDNFLEAFDILTATPITVNDAQAFCNTYLMSAGVFSGMGNAAGSPLINLPLASIPFIANALRKLYNHYLAKTPSILPPLLVYSDPNFYQCVAPVNNRDHILRDIITAWEQGVTPILVGEPGCGKTSILIEVARRIHRKTFPRFNGEGYKVFGGSAISLTNAGGMWGGDHHIERILKKISEKKEHTILLLDEIHTFNANQKTLLRTYFDNSPQSISYAVFATTYAGAQEFFKGDDGSLERRFIRIRVPELSRQEVECALQQQARSMAPSLIIHSEVIHRIVDHAASKLAQSKKILCQILRKALKKNMTHTSQETYNNKLAELSLARDEHFKQLVRAQSSNLHLTEKIRQLEEEKRTLYKKLEDEYGVIKQHSILLAKRTQVIFKIFDISQKILGSFQKYLLSKGRNLSHIEQQLEEHYFTDFEFINQIHYPIKEFIYYNFFLLPTIAKKIDEFETKHSLISEIKIDFVTESDLILEEPVTQEANA